jgi:predicted transcriptional regulator of viral defense system
MPHVTRVLKLARRGPITARDLTRIGVRRDVLFRLHRRGELQRVARGVYRATKSSSTELTSIVEVAKRAPNAVACLLTALQIHGLTTELPHEVWILIHNRARAPRIEYPKLHVVRASGRAATFGIERRTVENTTVRVTSPAKTVADCFRYRGHVGLDIALSALRGYLRRGSRRDDTIDALVKAAHADRVYSVMRPYLEALA